MLHRSETLRFVAWGEFGSFTKPEFRSDRVTQAVMPPTAAEGVVRSIHWHPEADIHAGEPAALGVEVAEIWVLNPISHARVRLNEIGELPRRDQPCLVDPRQTSEILLRNPKYLIAFQYVSRTSQATVKKAAEIFLRRLAKGQCFQQPYLGRRRYPAFVREATPDDVPIDTNMDLGNFPWRIAYDAPRRGTTKYLHTFRAQLRRGILVVPSYLDAMETAGKEAAL